MQSIIENYDMRAIISNKGEYSERERAGACIFCVVYASFNPMMMHHNAEIIPSENFSATFIQSLAKI